MATVGLLIYVIIAPIAMIAFPLEIDSSTGNWYVVFALSLEEDTSVIGMA
jgi:hypothetical protein